MRVEELNENPADIPLDPDVEYIAQEFPISTRTHAPFRHHVAIFVIVQLRYGAKFAAVGLPFDDGNELHIFDAAAAQKSIDFIPGGRTQPGLVAG